MQAQYDKRFNERNNTNTSVVAKELINAFKDRTPAMGIEAERDFFNNIVTQIPLQAYNQAISQVITPNNQVLLIQQQKKDWKNLPQKDAALALVNDVLSRQYEVYADETITDPLIETLPAKGSIKEVKESTFGTTEYLLSNGVKVIVKPTDYKEDEILFQAFKEGGAASYPVSEANNVLLLGNAFQLSDMGKFDQKMINRYLTGKTVGLGYGIGQFSNYFQGNSTVKDLPTLMELIYTAFTNINPNEETYNNFVARIIPQYEAAEKSPEFIFEQHKQNATYGNNPLTQVVTADVMRGADYNRMMQLYKESVADPSDYTFLFTGNVDVEAIKPLLEQYIATIPQSAEQTKGFSFTPIDNPEGKVVDNFTIDMAAPADRIYGFYSHHSHNVLF